MIKCQRAANPSVHGNKPSLSLFLSDSQWQLSRDRQSRTGGRCCRFREITLVLSTHSSSPPLSLSVHSALLLFLKFLLSHNYPAIIKKTEDANSNHMCRAIKCVFAFWLSFFSPRCSFNNGSCGYFCYNNLAFFNRLNRFKLNPW